MMETSFQHHCKSLPSVIEFQFLKYVIDDFQNPQKFRFTKHYVFAIYIFRNKNRPKTGEKSSEIFLILLTLKSEVQFDLQQKGRAPCPWSCECDMVSGEALPTDFAHAGYSPKCSNLLTLTRHDSTIEMCSLYSFERKLSNEA